jgi:hypothetical protein
MFATLKSLLRAAFQLLAIFLVSILLTCEISYFQLIRSWLLLAKGTPVSWQKLEAKRVSYSTALQGREANLLALQHGPLDSPTFVTMLAAGSSGRRLKVDAKKPHFGVVFIEKNLICREEFCSLQCFFQNKRAQAFAVSSIEDQFFSLV